MLSLHPDLWWGDVETSGLNPEVHEILSVCILTVIDGETVIHTKYFLPVGPVDPRAAAVNGYTPELWAERGAQAWTLDDLKEIKRLTEGRLDGNKYVNKIPAGCNVTFDIAFLASYYKRAGLDVPSWSHRKVDIQSLAMPLYVAGRIKSVALSSLCAFFEIPTRRTATEGHEADEDVSLAIQVFEKLCELYGIAAP